MKENTARVLVVDDEADIRFLIRKILEKENYLVDEAEDAGEAWEKINREKYDLILLDVMMPEVDGVELSRKIKEDERFRDMPIIMLTVMSAVEDKEWGFDYGFCDAYLTKPIIKKELLETISWVLEKWKKKKE